MKKDSQKIHIRLLYYGLLLAGTMTLFIDTVIAANGATLSKDLARSVDTPQWLYLATGGMAVGASALLASFVTERDFIDYIHSRSVSISTGGTEWYRYVNLSLQTVGLGAVALAIYVGYVGPELPTASLTILITFVGVRAGLPIVAYLVGNIWPALNPWRTFEALPNGFLTYPESYGRWPGVAGLLLLVWFELIFPVSTLPSVLATAIVMYTLITTGGVFLFGSSSWFNNVDPLSIIFRMLGAVAPLQWKNGTLSLQLPGSELTETDVISDLSDIAFIIALIWELTYSGFVSTTTGAAIVEGIVGLFPGILSAQGRAVIVYSVLLLGGYAVFFGAYKYAATVSRRRANTYITARSMSIRFAPPLIAIAAGYHLAHYASLTVSLSPAFFTTLAAPLSPPANPLVLSTPPWFNAVGIASVLIGHLLAVWAAHAIAFDLFSSRPIAIRSQYPFVAVMIGYTIISLWIISLPGATPPFLP
jgi:hypothetical protein